MKKINLELVKELIKQGKPDREIANIIHCHSDSICRWRSKEKFGINIEKRIKNDIPLTNKIKSILIGTLLGDSSLRIGKYSVLPSFSCEHGFKQKEYCFFKYNLLKCLNPSFTYHIRKTPDPRNQKLYESYTIRTKSNKYYTELYDLLYKEGKKSINEMLLNQYYNEQSLALHFMDDGSKTQHSYQLATNCFNKVELTMFMNFLFTKWRIETSLFKNNIVYIKTNSRKLFEYLILPYMHESMLYKLHVS
jgi:hypothetical protein